MHIERDPEQVEHTATDDKQTGHWPEYSANITHCQRNEGAA